MLFASSRGCQSRRLRPCTSQLVRGIEGLSVASRPILERGGRCGLYCGAISGCEDDRGDGREFMCAIIVAF